MRDPRLFLFFPLEIGEDQKKDFHVRRCVFAENIGEDQKKRSLLFVMRPLIFYETPHFLRGPRL